MRNYSLKQIQTFIEVTRQGSVSKAAEKLCVTQPAVSMHIRQLEEAFGVALVEAQGRGIRLTDAGRTFAGRANVVMAELHELESLMAEYAGAQKGRIALAVVSTAKYFVPMLLMRFSRLYPDIEVRLHIENRESVLGMLERSEADLVIMGRAPRNMTTQAAAFATNPMAIVAAPSHALAGRKNLPFSVLADYAFVMRESGSGTRAAMERLFALHEVPLKVAMEMPSNETIKQAVMAGMGLSFLSLRTLRQELAGGYLVQLDINGMPIVGQWFVTHMASKTLSPAARAFKAFLVEQGGTLMDAFI
ncbi:MAG: LysR family transcriptional regulator [Brachymonas sp.]|jgi:DNA-binding transcriptional LysR family regulator|nr:LysR family transcriptional regulator [Brachymonas sp.]MBP6139238.1 LysR family transcriptional regulator [Brachymonas sp.]MBP6966856.1 LysR family transcriptional regulator [Brachymonas sp.]MBP7246687.1 LysR family transcriptional regulator [Brachymonas sp.]MBP7740109.1 LysR family transcriptional regulator [Brachymonas sp.]